MEKYKIQRGADGNIKSIGPNVAEYNPCLDDGDTLEYTDTLPPLTTAQHFAALRAARDTRLADTDKMLLPDYPITAETLEKVKTYRADLRDLPDQPGAPWPDGDIPWPAKPEI